MAPLELLSNPKSQMLFWSVIGLTVLFGLILASILYFLIRRQRSKTDFKSIAASLNLNFYNQLRPYAAGVYKGRGVLLQKGQGAKDPAVAVFCDNPLKKNLRLNLQERSKAMKLKKWTQPSFLRPSSLKIFFKDNPHLEVLQDSALEEATHSLWETQLKGALELKGRTISYIEAPGEQLSSANQYTTALNLCVGLAEALEHTPISLKT